MPRPLVAFYAPMKPPGHPVPSGDRLIARNTLAALRMSGFDAETVSELRTLDVRGDPEQQVLLIDEAGQEAEQVTAALALRNPAAWFTYHSHYKAPDLLGPAVTEALNLPYLISEPSISPRRRDGPWAAFAHASERALACADRLLWTTARDRPALEEAGLGPKLTHLPGFIDPGTPVPPRAASNPPRLLTVAMMRPGDKLESYRRLAAALAHLPQPWSLEVIGDGPARSEVETALAQFAAIRFHGAIDDPNAIRSAMQDADLLVWPGVGEGVGMVWLEAQAAGLPVVAEDGHAARDLVKGGLLAPPDDPKAFVAAIGQALADRSALSATARKHIEAHHSIASAARIIGTEINALAGSE